MPHNTNVHFSFKKSILFSSILIVFFFGLCETAFRINEIYNPPLTIDFDGGFSKESRVFVTDPKDPSKMVTQKRKVGTFADQRFSRQKPAGTFRIVALGESSIYRLAYELRELTDILSEVDNQTHQKIEIINAGGQSYGSQRLVIVAKEMLDYEPDLLMVYMGHNEFEEIEQLNIVDPENSKFFEFINHSATVRYLTKKSLAIRVAQLNWQRRLLSRDPNTPRAWAYKFNEQDVTQRMIEFRRNLEYIVRMYQSREIKTLIGTIPSNLWNPYLPPGKSMIQFEKVKMLLDEKKYEEARLLSRNILKHTLGRHQSSDTENEIIREVSKKYNLSLVDVESEIVDAEPHHIPGEKLFSDHCHLNAVGNKVLMTAFLPYFVEVLNSRRPVAAQ
jgi:lysophospholipase L1-like esterase